MATEAFEDIADTFEFLDDWEDRYRHVIVAVLHALYAGLPVEEVGRVDALGRLVASICRRSVRTGSPWWGGSGR
jgi:hypothetical protein